MFSLSTHATETSSVYFSWLKKVWNSGEIPFLMRLNARNRPLGVCPVRTWLWPPVILGDPRVRGRSGLAATPRACPRPAARPCPCPRPADAPAQAPAPPRPCPHHANAPTPLCGANAPALLHNSGASAPRRTHASHCQAATSSSFHRCLETTVEYCATTFFSIPPAPTPTFLSLERPDPPSPPRTSTLFSSRRDDFPRYCTGFTRSRPHC